MTGAASSERLLVVDDAFLVSFEAFVQRMVERVLASRGTVPTPPAIRVVTEIEKMFGPESDPTTSYSGDLSPSRVEKAPTTLEELDAEIDRLVARSAALRQQRAELAAVIRRDRKACKPDCALDKTCEGCGTSGCSHTIHRHTSRRGGDTRVLCPVCAREPRPGPDPASG